MPTSALMICVDFWSELVPAEATSSSPVSNSCTASFRHGLEQVAVNRAEMVVDALQHLAQGSQLFGGGEENLSGVPIGSGSAQEGGERHHFRALLPWLVEDEETGMVGLEELGNLKEAEQVGPNNADRIRGRDVCLKVPILPSRPVVLP